MATPLPDDEAHILEEALVTVRQQTQLMRKFLDTPGKLMDALKCSSQLVSELRTSNLGPKQYYELYMSVFDALRHLSAYLRDNHPVNHLADLYELVQYAGNIVPRLYLMITVGTVYMSIENAPVKEIMKDMMEMSRGVQHPVRGLFLRYYLSGQARDYMPTGGGDGPEGNLQDSISFILTNFVEMNKLWVRLQHQGHSREREKRTQERRELQQLVGSNLVRLSQLVDLDIYKTVILQPLLEQVVQCRDVLAQEYLLEVITQVFPDEFHLHTLDPFLAATSRLNPNVNVKAIVIGLMDRLAAYAARESESVAPEQQRKREEEAVIALMETMRLSKDQKPDGPSKETTNDSNDVNGPDLKSSETNAEAGSADSTVNGDGKALLEKVQLYEIFYEQVVKLANVQNLPIQDTTALLVSLANLALSIYPERLEYMDQILSFTNEKVTENVNNADLHSPTTQANLLKLLVAPVTAYHSLFTVFVLPHYIPLLSTQSYPTRRAIAGDVARQLLKNKTVISTTEHLDGVLGILGVLIKEGLQQGGGYPGLVGQRRGAETDETIEEQGWLARLVHQVKSEKNDIQFQLIQGLRKSFAEGNERIKHTYPALITSCLQLARRFKAREHFDDSWSKQSTALYKFIHNTISTLYTRVNGCADLCLRLFVSCGQIADQTGFEEAAYESFAQAFIIYEEAISDSKAQFQAVCILAGALHGTRGFGRDYYDTLITKCALHGSKLLKKPDQCRAVYLASHLWWGVENPNRGEEDSKDLYRDGKRVLECLQRALRVADACMDTAVSVELFVEILNRYVYYFDQQNEAVTTKYLNGLIELIHSNLQTNNDAGSSIENPKRHFLRTLEYIDSRQFEDVITEAR